MESDVEHRETAILRGAITAEQAAHGTTSRLQIQVIGFRKKNIV